MGKKGKIWAAAMLAVVLLVSCDPIGSTAVVLDNQSQFTIRIDVAGMMGSDQVPSSTTTVRPMERKMVLSLSHLGTAPMPIAQLNRMLKLSVTIQDSQGTVVFSADRLGEAAWNAISANSSASAGNEYVCVVDDELISNLTNRY